MQIDARRKLIPGRAQGPLRPGIVHEKDGTQDSVRAFAQPPRRMTNMSNLIVCRSLRMSSLFLVALLLALVGSRAVRADNFSAGQFITYGQSDWGLIPTATNVLDDNFAVVYASQGAVLVVGDTANFDLVFTSPLDLGKRHIALPMMRMTPRTMVNFGSVVSTKTEPGAA
jgi:hypothetical protein